MNGENLRVLTEKLRAVSLSLQKGIQARWRANTYDGRQGATKLPAGVLQLVVEVIVSAKGLFSLLNRFVWRGNALRWFCIVWRYLLFVLWEQTKKR